MGSDKTIEMNKLYDLYGELLTDRQKAIFKLYYFEDMSLGEISEQIKISRQGIFDNLKRAENSLLNFEEKLKLKKTQEKREKTIEKLKKIVSKNIFDTAIREKAEKDLNTLI